MSTQPQIIEVKSEKEVIITPKLATNGRKIFLVIITLIFLPSLISSPKAPQNEPNVEARQAQIQDFGGNKIGYLDSEIYQGGVVKIESKNSTSSLKSSQNSEISQISKSTETNPKLEIAKIEKYRQAFFPTSPIPAEMIYANSLKSGIPVSFLLAVCHNESHCGTKGRAVQTQNPFNIGNTDCGDGKPVAHDKCNNFLENWQKGFDTFANLIKTCYFKPDESITLQTWINRDFRAVSCDIVGKRYMSSPLARDLYLERITSLIFYEIN